MIQLNILTDIAEKEKKNFSDEFETQLHSFHDEKSSLSTEVAKLKKLSATEQDIEESNRGVIGSEKRLAY